MEVKTSQNNQQLHFLPVKQNTHIALASATQACIAYIFQGIYKYKYACANKGVQDNQGTIALAKTGKVASTYTSTITSMEYSGVLPYWANV